MDSVAPRVVSMGDREAAGALGSIIAAKFSLSCKSERVGRAPGVKIVF